MVANEIDNPLTNEEKILRSSLNIIFKLVLRNWIKSNSIKYFWEVANFSFVRSFDYIIEEIND